MDVVTGNPIAELGHVAIFPASHYVIHMDKIREGCDRIEEELRERIKFFKSQDKLIEAQRISERTNFDLEMLRETGFCSGIENYSRYFDGRKEGQRPFCLLDYFPKDFITFIDESHVTVPQIHAMYGGDKARKENLVNYGFRLPAARDNRPLTFEEWENKVGLATHDEQATMNDTEAHQQSVIFVSATPADYEMQKSEGIVIDQLIRPTGLLDPDIEVRPSEHQIDDLMEEIQVRIRREERVLVTTLTKRMAEELDDYLRRYGIRSAYIHSDIDTIERVKIMEDLRKGLYDVLVGVNLLREGLDLPEVSLVAILDADKEGFLRDKRSLTQTAGRAARHVNGKVLMYGDHITQSMQATIDETNRRRTIQIAYNEAHHITPTPIKKAINSSALSSLYKDEEAEKQKLENAIREGWKHADWQTMSVKDLRKAIEQKRRQMLAAAKALDFDSAAHLRDEMLQMEDRLDAIS